MTAPAILITVPACIKCGATERDKNGNCKACARAMSKAWYAANKDKAKARMIAWHKDNPEKSKAGQVAWAKANPDKVKAAAKRNQAKPAYKAAKAEYYKANLDKFKESADSWRAENPHELRIHQQNSRARELGREGQLSKGLIGKLLEEQQGLCSCCQQPLAEDFHMDHKVSLHNGGLNVDDNIHLLTTRCNLTKSTKNFDVFMQAKSTV